MKRLLITEAVSAGLLLVLIVTIIQMAACSKQDKIMETEAERSEVRFLKDIWFYAGEIGTEVSPLRDSGMEENIWGLCFSHLYLDAAEVGRENLVRNFGKDGEAFRFYKKVVEEEKKTYLTIGINPALETSSGIQVTADDLLFNYYFRCDPSADTVEDIWSGIEGGTEYYYGTDQIAVRQKEMKKRIEKPDSTIQKEIKANIIQPELEKEYAWAEELYAKEEYKELTKDYPDAATLFAHYYAYQTNYHPAGKTKEEILKDIAGQYGANYHALEKVTGKSYQTLVEKYVLSELLKEEKKDLVTEITGLKKLDEHTVQVILKGTDPDIRKYMDFWILPVKDYGIGIEYQKQDGFVWKKGGAFSVYETAKKYYKGSGAFYCYSPNEAALCFYKNSHYYKKNSDIGKIYMSFNRAYTADEIVEKMLMKKMDLAVLPVDENTEKLIKDRGTGAAYKLALLPLSEETEYGILYRTDYINATTFPEKPVNLNQIFREMGKLKVNQ